MFCEWITFFEIGELLSYNFFVNFSEGISGSDSASKPVGNVESGCYCNDPNFPILCYCDQYGFQVTAKTLTYT